MLGSGFVLNSWWEFLETSSYFEMLNFRYPHNQLWLAEKNPCQIQWDLHRGCQTHQDTAQFLTESFFPTLDCPSCELPMKHFNLLLYYPKTVWNVCRLFILFFGLKFLLKIVMPRILFCCQFQSQMLTTWVNRNYRSLDGIFICLCSILLCSWEFPLVTQSWRISDLLVFFLHLFLPSFLIPNTFVSVPPSCLGLDTSSAVYCSVLVIPCPSVT